MRGAGLSSQEEGAGRPLQTQLQRPVLTGSGLGQAGKTGAPQQRLWEGLRPGLCSLSSSSSDSVWPAGHQPPGDPEPPSLSSPALSRGVWGWGGLSWVEVPSWGDQEQMGAGTLVLRAVCASQRLEGRKGRRFACSPPRLSGSKAPPPGTCSLVL